jgi:hypothetical protein
MRHPGNPNSALLALGDLLVEGTQLVQMVATGAVPPSDPQFQQFARDMFVAREAQQRFLPMVARHYLEVCAAFGAVPPTVNDDPNGFGNALDAGDDDEHDDRVEARRPLARIAAPVAAGAPAAAPAAVRTEATFLPPTLDVTHLAILEDLPNLNAVARNPQFAGEVAAAVEAVTFSDGVTLLSDSVRATLYEALNMAAQGAVEPFRAQSGALAPRFARGV